MSVTEPLGSCASGGGAVGATVSAALQFFAAAQCVLNEPWPKQALVPNGSAFDFIIVGGGTAGATLAARLSEVATFSVLLIEAGGDPPQESIIPTFKDVMKGSVYDWNFTTVNDKVTSQALQAGVQRQPRGKLLGGSGSINDMIYARGFPADYEEWAALVGEEWKWQRVLEYFKKTEHLTDEGIINDANLMAYHNRGGDIEVAGFNVSTYTTDRFLEAFKELGFDIVPDMTNPQYRKNYAGRFSHTISEGRRDGSLMGLLNKAAIRDNLKVLKHSLVTKILFENNTAVGVEVLAEIGNIQVFANREVIISAGTFNSAKLLLISGIGPEEHLNAFGIPVVVNLPVGDNLHDHVMVLNFIASENGTCYTDHSTNYMNMIKYLYDKSGPFSRANSLGAYLSKTPSFDLPDFAIYPSCVPLNIGLYDNCVAILGFNVDICQQLEDFNHDYEILSLAVVLLKPKSRGKVRLRSLDPLDKPLIYSGTFKDQSDLVGLPEAVEVAWSLASTSYFSKMNASVVNLKLPMCDGLEDYQWRKCQAMAMATSAWHAVGTAAMGKVVDSRLRVYGVSGLRVVDASVMPKVIRGNTNAPVIMIAEQAADFIKEQHGVIKSR